MSVEGDRMASSGHSATVSSGTTPGLSSGVDEELEQQAGIVTAASAAVFQHGGAAGGRAALPGVLADVPVAVLVIDQGTGAVIYANTAAVELAGNVRLPIEVDAWGASAGLTDLAGMPLARSSGPLSLIAQGQPVTGEAVRLRPGTSSEPERAAEPLDDQLLWVTGFSLSQSGSAEQLALVVFLKIDAESIEDPDAYLQALRERAVVATDITFTITDPRQPDNPLVWVNPSFTRITGYEYGEAVGRNCRFLQGPATSADAIAEIRQAVADQRTVSTTLLNYRKDGTAFWNQVAISPVFDGEGELVSFVGVQTDVTERVRVEHEREAAFAAERSARQEAELARAIAEQARADAVHAQVQAEWAQNRLALMAEATTALISTLDMPELLDRLAALCVPRLADWVVITVAGEDGEVRQSAARHRDGLAHELQQFSSRYVMHLPEDSPTRRSIERSRPVHLEELTEEVLSSLLTNPGAREAYDRLGGTSLLTVPMVARRRTLGAMALVLTSEDRHFSQDDIDLAQDLGRRAALVLDNVRLYQEEHTVADTLQRSLLPELPEIPGLVAAAHYISASSAADVGGDFYDLLQLPDDSVAIVIGDVVGHDVAAAAAMGHLRGIVRACAWDADPPDPGPVLARVDRLVQGLHVAAMATMVYVRALPPSEPGAPWRLEAVNAGHPPPIVRYPDGTVELLDHITGLLVGVDVGAQRQTRTVDLPPGSTLVAYTDGLVERPGTDLDERIEQLCRRLSGAPLAATPRELCDAAVEAPLDRRDDVALIAVRFG
jgi:PAS domain S-box-containing protein